MEEFLFAKIDEIAFTEVAKEEALWSSGVLDSITVVELAVEVENEFNISIPFEEIIVENFETVERLVAYIQKKKNSEA
ncbi:MAG: acyl carrier protein [Flavobacteriales bacterium]